jgi:uncharacterized metal-binding protein
VIAPPDLGAALAHALNLSILFAVFIGAVSVRMWHVVADMWWFFRAHRRRASRRRRREAAL